MKSFLLTLSAAASVFAFGCSKSARDPNSIPDMATEPADLSGTDVDFAFEPLPGYDGNPPVISDDAGLMTHDPVTCDEAAMSKSYVGCDYWPTVTANGVWSIFDYAVVVSNPGPTAAMVTVTGPNSTNQTAMVPSNELVTIYLPWVPALKTPDADNCTRQSALTASIDAPKSAYHLVSSVPVIVYQFNALEYKGAGGPAGKSWAGCPGDTKCMGIKSGCFSFSNDASLLLPSTAMTGNYRVFGKVEAGGTGPFMVITATVDNTTVKVKPAAATLIADGSGVTFAPNTVATFTMNQGDVKELILTPMMDTADFSGTLVQADQPVQVITGNACTNNPTTAAACDHIEETIFPAETLGKDYVVTVPTGPNKTAVGHSVRLYGNVDATTLTLTPAVDGKTSITINAGEVVTLGTGTKGVTIDFRVSGDHEFAVSTFQLGGSIVDPQGFFSTTPSKGDPSQSFFASVEQYRDKYVFLAPNDYDVSFADVVIPNGISLVLDSQPVTAAATAIAGTSYSVVRIPLPKTTSGAHTLTGSQPFGIQVMGYGSYTSYQYPGGLDLKVIAAPPPPVS
jgi:hypothetical protein